MSTVAHTPTQISPTTIKLDANIKSRVKALAKARRRTAHSLLLEAVEIYMEREEKREALRQDAMRVWREYEMTGLHVTHEEADNWMEKLEKGQDGEPPKCHA
ncbi:MAG: CopG family transcriptional regulator [Desulfobulbaceae bacterium]|nr:CopG family transcriptional regulator [Desulfobulbaceae bacterium]